MIYKVIFIFVLYVAQVNCAIIKLCQDKFIKGECIVVTMDPDDKCKNLDDDKKQWASSLSIKHNCFRLYEKGNCEGKSLYVSSRSPGHNDLEVIGMNKMISSIGKCFSVDICTKSKRSRNHGNCPFVIDYLTVGFIPWLPKDTSNINPPVVYYQSNRLKNRTEVMEAVIEIKHLNTGTDISSDIVENLQDITRSKQVEPGYILSKRLGGSGTDRRNIFPQDKEINDPIWRDIEEQVVKAVMNYGSARYTINLHYNSPTETRPDFLVYRILGGKEEKFINQGDVINQPEIMRR